MTKDEFFACIGPLNVHPQITNSSYPYASDWILQDGSRAKIGHSVGRVEGGRLLTDYFLEVAP